MVRTALIAAALAVGLSGCNTAYNYFEEEPEQKEDDDDKLKVDEPLSINFGESVLEWLPFDDPPTFQSLREELLFNEQSTMDRELMNRMTVQCVAAIDDTDYTLFYFKISGRA